MFVSEAKFNKAVEIIQGLPKDGPVKPTVAQQLEFYKYYKQGTIGSVNTARPGGLDFTGKAKWDAWKSVEHTSKDNACAQYVALVSEVLSKSEDSDAKKWLAELENTA